MPEKNAEAVRGVYDALNILDWEAVFRDMHPEVEMTFQRAPDAGTVRRREAIQGFLEDYLGAFEEMTFELEELFENDDQVVALVTRRARPKGGSEEMVVRNGHIWTVRDGTILSMKSYPDPEKALEAARLPSVRGPGERG